MNSPEDIKRGTQDLDAKVILGYVQSEDDARLLPPVYNFRESIERYPDLLKADVVKLARRAHRYRMSGCVGKAAHISTYANFQNDLRRLDPT